MQVDAAPRLTLLYRGELSSCNYDCGYCPFAKRRDSAAILERDAAALHRFSQWVGQQRDLRLNILFTPWGEGLVRRYYRETLVRLSWLPQVERVAIQTNLATMPSWTAAAAPGKLSLWCTYHPEQTTRARFLRRVGQLQALGVAHSIGMVGIRRFFPEIAALREALPASTYLWINAYHDEGPGYYRPEESNWLTGIDPWFDFNLSPRPSLGAPCQAGETALSVDGSGNIRRCHFVPTRYGNIYDAGWRAALQARVCPNTACDCYIGYMQRDDLPFHHEFGTGTPGRLPAGFQWLPPADWQAQCSALTAPQRLVTTAVL